MARERLGNDAAMTMMSSVASNSGAIVNALEVPDGSSPWRLARVVASIIAGTSSLPTSKTRVCESRSSFTSPGWSESRESRFHSTVRCAVLRSTNHCQAARGSIDDDDVPEVDSFVAQPLATGLAKGVIAKASDVGHLVTQSSQPDGRAGCLAAGQLGKFAVGA